MGIPNKLDANELIEFVKIYNHENSGKYWSVDSFTTALESWLKPKKNAYRQLTPRATKDLTGRLLLTAAFIESKQFELCLPCTQFEGLNMSYYAKNGVLLFFNEKRPEHELSTYYAGYGEMRMGKYHAVAFRWIHKQDQLSEIYKALTGESI